MSKQIYVESMLGLSAFITGFEIAIYYDVIAIIKKVFYRKKWLEPIGDIAFWIGTFLLLSQMIQTQAGGRFRWYIIFFTSIAIFLYKKIVKEHIVDFMSTIIRRVLDIVISLILSVFKPLFWMKIMLTGNIKSVKIALCKRINCHNRTENKNEP